MALATVINLLLFVGLCLFLKKQFADHKLSTQVFIGLLLGCMLGVGAHIVYVDAPKIISDSLSFTNIVGVGYIKLLQLVVLPLIFISVLSAILKIEQQFSLKRIATSIILVLLVTTAIAAGVSILTTILFQLDASSITRTQMQLVRSEQLQSLWQGGVGHSPAELILNLIPQNFFYDLSGQRPTSTISVVIVSVMIGSALIKLEETEAGIVARMRQCIDDAQVVIMKLVNMVLSLTPYGVMALVLNISSTSSLESIMPLFAFLMASYFAIAVMFLVHLLLIRLAGRSIIDYLKGVMPLLVFAFTSRSSAGSIPLNIKTQTESLGVSSSIANFSASIGATMGQNGCAGVYPAMLATMIAPSVGISPMDFDFISMLLVITTISSLGVAGIGGGATFAALIVLSAMDLPIALAALLISIEPLIDMARTALNVNGAVTAGVVTQQLIGDQRVHQKGL